MLGSYLIVISENEVHFREVLMIHPFNRPTRVQTCRKHSRKSIGNPAWRKRPLSCSTGNDRAFLSFIFPL